MILEQDIIDFHSNPWLGSIVEVGLGVPILNMLTCVDGCSKTLVFGNVPYDRMFQPPIDGRSVSRGMASEMASAAWETLGMSGHAAHPYAFSLAVTGAYKTKKERGESHAWVHLHTNDFHATMHFTIPEANSREHAIYLAGNTIFIFMAIHMNTSMRFAYSCLQDWCQDSGVAVDVIDSPLFTIERQIEFLEPGKPLAFKSGMMTRVTDILRDMKKIYRGAFNPPTLAHEVIGGDAIFEIGAQNADKSRINWVELAQRVSMLSGMDKTVLLTDGTPLFIDLDDALMRAGTNTDDLIYVMGSDTYYRLIDPKYYAGDVLAKTAQHFIEAARIELAIDPDEFAQRGLGDEPWIGGDVSLSPACENPHLNIRSTSFREGGLDALHLLPESVQEYVKRHNPYRFVEKS